MLCLKLLLLIRLRPEALAIPDSTLENEIYKALKKNPEVIPWALKILKVVVNSGFNDWPKRRVIIDPWCEESPRVTHKTLAILIIAVLNKKLKGIQVARIPYAEKVLKVKIL